MAAQRRIDLVLDSVKRLLRIGATANLLNLLQKQHPADLAQIFSELPNRDREATFSLLVERNGRLAMEAISELGPEAGALLLATRSAEEIAKLAQMHKNGESPLWVRVYKVPDFVFFNHSSHVKASVECQTCHGPIETRDVLAKEVSTSMTTCMDCHVERKVSNECNMCHDLGQ